MTSINTLNSSGYYQLANQSGTAAQTGSSSTTNPTDALLQALSSSDTAKNNSAFTLDLSPQAQQYLNGLNTTGSSSTGLTGSLASALAGVSSGTSSLFGSATGDTSNPLGNTGSFLLTTQQQQAITAILEKYKDAPYTQDTFNQIQNDLNNAGLGTTTLSMEDQAKSFDPSLVLINDLNGGASGSVDTGVTTPTQEQSKSNTYMQQIIQQWQSLSATYQPGTGSKDTSSAGSPSTGSDGLVTALGSTGGA